ncbi:MAG: tryptophan synthase subunit alpha [Lachnospirales bacterium]
MNNTINKHSNKLLSIYFTAGYPNLDDTVPIIESLDKAGVDFIEIGMPFSDPVADGQVIQQSNLQALNNGMSVEKLFEQLEGIRNKVQIPLILMGYFNPVYQYGVENFCKKCAEVGIDGVIIPDLPLDEYEDNYKDIFEKNGIHNILLITPQTSEERIRKIDEASNGFIYMVSSSSTTGAKSSATEFKKEYFERIKNMNLKNPTMIGFGISNKETFDNACRYANGAIIGSAFVKHIGENGIGDDNIKTFVDKVRC